MRRPTPPDPSLPDPSLADPSPADPSPAAATVPAPSGVAKVSTGHVRGLDALRGLAALTVLVFHVATQTGATVRWVDGVAQTNVTSQYSARLDVGVQVFFALSAYLLFRPFLAALYADRDLPSFAAFWWRRFWRIYPGYWVALFLGAALFYPTINTWRDGVIFAALIQVYDRWRALGGLAQAWSLNAEIVLYAFLPLFAGLLVFATRRSSRRVDQSAPTPARADATDPASAAGAGARTRHYDRVVLLALALCVAISFAFRLYLFGANPSWRDQGVTWFPNHLDTFAVGMGLAWAAVVQESRGRTAMPAWLGWLADRPQWSLAGAWLCFWVVSALGLPLNLTPILGWKAFAHHGLYTLIAALIVLPGALGPLRDGVVARVLTSKPLEWIGEISYGIYLWHLMMVVYWVDRTGGVAFDANFWLVLVLTLVSSIVLGWLSWVLVERPLQRGAARVWASRSR